ncbi:MAG TPA: alpha/beta hydrolase [Sporosarcina psychrophila]|uniref:Alpha/beta hydrolase n=1 Tax=Sporosarcina psychrophila TaxID=1476 RepID=A0A921KF13_SPOPS|nr:alpha/beta hydrolase [Sporosarcina psychrophila]
MSGIIVEKNLVFGETEREYLTADIYKPSNCIGELPILVLIHGGAYQTGSKEMYKDWGEDFAQEGYFVMAINYRLSTPSYSTYPGVLEDMEMAMNWLVFNANNWKIDVGRIGLIGDSAGAYLAALFALKNEPFSYTICSVIGVYGVYNLLEECINPIIERDNNMFERFLGLPFKGNEKAFIDASPITYINNAVNSPTFDTKFFLIFGGADKVINPMQSKIFSKKLSEANIEVQIAEVEDKGHFWFNQLPGIEGGTVSDYPNNILYPKIISFLNNNVQNAESGNFSRKQLKALSNIENLTRLI